MQASEEAQPGLLHKIDRTPVTVGLVLCAIAVTMAKESGRSVEPFQVSAAYFYTEPWRLVASILPHGGLLHLFFNSWMTWSLGRPLEVRLGPPRMLALVVVLAASSMAAEMAFLSGGIGLSGVVYGFAGYFWARGQRDPLYRLVDRRIIEILTVWFFLCIVLTATGAYPVANIAHGMGALVGVLLGFGWRSISAVVVVLCLALGGPLRPYVSFDRRAMHRDYFNAAVHAYEDEDWQRGVELSERAIELGTEMPEAYHNYGVGLQRLGRLPEAAQAFAKRDELGWTGRD